MNVASGSAFEACVDTGVTGMTGTCSLRIQDNDGNDVQAPSTADIIETPAGSGIYCAQRTAPIPLGQYSLVWSDDGSYTPEHIAIDDLVIVSADAGTELPPIQEAEDGYAGGPCRAWTTPEEAAACCGDQSSNAVDFEMPVRVAGELLYEMSGRQFIGSCERTVRPCTTDDFCGIQVLSRGHVVTWDGSVWMGEAIPGPACSCGGVSRVLLPNYPVREIIEVKIDGVALDPSEYRIDGKRWLTRMRDEDGNRRLWPRCQALDMDSTEDGTFEVTYRHGTEIPAAGQMAAQELACQVRLACGGSSSSSDLGECKLPSGITRITRQAVTMDFAGFRAWGRQGGIWQTGLPLTDAFLNAYNPHGLRRRPLIWSPDQAPYAYEVGTVGGS